MSQQQRILVAAINVFIFCLLTYVGIVWALPLAKGGDWFGVALVAVVVGAVWSVVRGDAL
jgi:hypothetical protein